MKTWNMNLYNCNMLNAFLRDELVRMMPQYMTTTGRYTDRGWLYKSIILGVTFLYAADASSSGIDVTLDSDVRNLSATINSSEDGSVKEVCHIS